MSHFAKVENGTVTQVIVAEQDFIDSGAVGDPSAWIQTSYNTSQGVHRNGGTPLRKNYAGIGFVYDAGRDAFYASQPYPSWSLNEDTCVWGAPVAQPDPVMPTETTIGTFWSWNESTLSWDATEIPALGAPA
jgi:hypothetical protein